MDNTITKSFDYFLHYYASNETFKIRQLESIYNNDAYAYYYKMLEIIFSKGLWYTELDKLSVDSIYIKSYSIYTCLSKKKYIDITKTALDINLFDKEKLELQYILTNDIIIDIYSRMTRRRSVPVADSNANKVNECENVISTKNKLNDRKKASYEMTAEDHAELYRQMEKIGVNKKMIPMILQLNSYNDIKDAFDLLSYKLSKREVTNAPAYLCAILKK